MDIVRQHNDYAVSLLQQNDEIGSKEYLANAIDQLRHIVDNDSSTGNNSSAKATTTTTTEGTSSFGSTNVVFRAIPGRMKHDTSSHNNRGEGGDLLDPEAFHLFPRPFVFAFTAPFDLRQTNQAQVSSLMPSQRASCSAACLYNLGLVNHLQYIERGDNRIYQRETALQAYESAYFILLQMANLRPDDSAMILLMAICSNIAAIHYDLGDLVALRSWKHQLLCVLQSCQLGVFLLDQSSFDLIRSSLDLPDFSTARAA